MNPDNHRARKRFGQNFLHDPGTIQRIIQAIAPQKNEHIIEIGPGKGAITTHLLEQVEKLDVIEIDKDLVAALRTNFGNNQQLTIHETDALQMNFDAFNTNDLRVVGNLPYNISTPILFHLLSFRYCIKDMIFMLQKEVVERICADNGNKQYGRLSVMLQYYFNVESLFVIKPGAFTPSPKVDSAIVRLTPNNSPEETLLDDESFKIIVREAFSQRRKTLRNALKNYLNEEIIQQARIAPENRAENLSVSDFVRLANCYHSMKINTL